MKRILVSLGVIYVITFFAGVWALRDNGSHVSFIRDASAARCGAVAKQIDADNFCENCHGTHELISRQLDIIKTDATTCIDCHAQHKETSAENKFLAAYPGYQAASFWGQKESGQLTRLYSGYRVPDLHIEAFDNGTILVTANDITHTPIKILP